METKETKRKSPKFRIYLDTRGFTKLWTANIEQKQGWLEFLDAVWAMGIADEKTVASIAEYSKDSGFDPRKWTKAQIHEFISPKAYTKCNGIRKRLSAYYKKEGLEPLDGAVLPILPRGAKQFLRKSSSDRPSNEELLGLFQIQIAGLTDK
jgi:hypothetical protein